MGVNLTTLHKGFRTRWTVLTRPVTLPQDGGSRGTLSQGGLVYLRKMSTPRLYFYFRESVTVDLRSKSVFG